jgi:molecular chaperone DnaK (HSP70)
MFGSMRASQRSHHAPARKVFFNASLRVSTVPLYVAGSEVGGSRSKEHRMKHLAWIQNAGLGLLLTAAPLVGCGAETGATDALSQGGGLKGGLPASEKGIGKDDDAGVDEQPGQGGDKEADKAAKEAEKAAERAAKSAEKAAKEAEKAAEKAAKNEEKAAKEAAKSAEKAAKEAEKAAEKAAKEAAKAAEQAARDEEKGAAEAAKNAEQAAKEAEKAAKDAEKAAEDADESVDEAGDEDADEAAEV